jgi:hypothetical protein
MAGTLGLFVTSDRHLDTILKLCRAARDKGVSVVVFLTHMGTLLTQVDTFKELTELAEVSLCNVGFEAHGLSRPVPGLDEKQYATQARHGDLIEDCDRYLVF